MVYQIDRNGQSYGPYTVDELKAYLASGNVLPTDLAKSSEMSDWVPVSQLLTQAGPSALAQAPPVQFAGASYTPSLTQANTAPPNLHWVLVLVFGVLCGFFLFVWMFVQAAWLRRIQHTSQAIWYYTGAISALFVAVLAAAMSRNSAISSVLCLVYIVLLMVGHFSMRASLEEYYSRTEPIGLRLSPVMTFFFNTIYFQYHFNRINEAKQASLYGAPRAL